MRFNVVFGIDMETDIGSWTPGYRGVREGTPLLLDLFAKRDVEATFFWVGIAARDNPGMAKRVAQAGHETGFHSLYHETVGDALFPIPGVYPLLPEELENRLAIAKNLVREATGVEPTSFRSPRLFGSTHLVNVLERLGIGVDSSYPMYYFRKRLEPYHPSALDWTEKGEMKILEIPNFADLSMDSHDQYGRDRDQWPLFRTESAESLMKHIEGFLEFTKGRLEGDPVLCFYFHPWEFVEMPQGEIYSGEGYVRPDPFIVRNCGEYALAQMDILISALKAAGGEFLTCRDLARHYERG
jgi:peptidoglycan/xylan/chitin deacetylase (PgdA/CDA1 family)